MSLLPPNVVNIRDIPGMGLTINQYVLVADAVGTVVTFLFPWFRGYRHGLIFFFLQK